MAFDNHYPNRKDWRRPYRGSKAFDSTCRNQGGCPWCADGRKHRERRQTPIVERAGREEKR